MGRCSTHHLETDDMGHGRCSVPMRMGGLPSGFCDAPAFGAPPPTRWVWNYAQRQEVRADGRYSGHVPGLACPAHGGPASRVFRDGDAWCAVGPDFTNLQESPAGFGPTPEDARKALRAVEVSDG
jgi:hypothetical protein